MSVGEMYHLQGYALKSYEATGFKVKEYPLVCTCGAALRDCDFWCAVERECGLDFARARFRSNATVPVRRLIQSLYLALGPRGLRLAGRVSRTLQGELDIAANCNRVYAAVARVSGASYIVDSSKSMYQYSLLHSGRSAATKLICLHRDGRAVSCSMVRGARVQAFEGGEPFDQAVAAWRRSNQLIRLFSHRTWPESRITVHYERFCAAPQEELDRIQRVLGIDLPRFHVALGEEVRHNIGGSPSRFRSDKGIRLDERWRGELSPDRARRFEALGGRMNRKLGYR